VSVESDIAKIYSGLDVDVGHIQRIIGCKNRNKIERDSIKSNASVLSSIQVYDKMYGFSYVRKKDRVDMMLKEVNNRGGLKQLSNNWISRKKKIEFKKKKMDY
jgi:hypothetical protein